MQAAQSFADRVGQYQKVAVYAFDGSPDLDADRRLRRQRARGRERARDAAGRAIRRPTSTAAVIEGVRVLSSRWSARPSRCASARWSCSPTAPIARTARRAEDVGAGARRRRLRDLRHRRGRGDRRGELLADRPLGHVRVAEPRGHPEAASTRSAARIEASSRRYYLLSYCSPSRAGEHDVDDRGRRARRRRGRLSLSLQRRRLRPHLRPEPAALLRRAPPEGRAARSRGAREGRRATAPARGFSRPPAEAPGRQGPGLAAPEIKG